MNGYEKFEDPSPSKETIARYKNATPQNYNHVIWYSIHQYNWRSQLDIALILINELPNQKDQVIKTNISYRVYQMFFELLDHLALVCRMVLEADENRSVYEIYVKSENVQARSFYKAAMIGLPDEDVKKLYRINFNEKEIKDPKYRKRSSKAVRDAVSMLKNNLQEVAQIYVDHEDFRPKKDYSGTIKGSFGIKHGYKVIQPDEIARSIWKINEGIMPVMHDIIDLKTPKDGSYHIIRTGQISDDPTKVSDLRAVHKHMRGYAETLQGIAKIQFYNLKDEHASISLLSNVGVLKQGANDLCLCGSGLKFKKCHRGKYT